MGWLDQLGGHQKLSLQLEITPTINFPHGILLFSSENEDGTGDFLSLAKPMTSKRAGDL